MCVSACVCVCVRACVCVIVWSHYRYIYKLADLHKEQNSYVEAGYTLLLHAELLQVCNEYDCSIRVTVLGIIWLLYLSHCSMNIT